MTELYWHNLFCTEKFQRRCCLLEFDCNLCVKVEPEVENRSALIYWDR